MDLYYTIGFVYVAFVVLVAAKSPRVALSLILALAPIQRALPGLPWKMTLADLNLALTFLVFCFKHVSAGKQLRWGPLTIPICLYLGVCVLSSAANWRGDDTMVSLAQMVPYMIFALIVFSLYGTVDDLKPACYGLLGMGVFLGLSVIATGSAQVYAMNKNGLGSSLACIAVMCAEIWLGTNGRKKKIFLFCLVVTACALLITLSRGAWMAAMGGLGLILTLRRDFKTLGRTLMVLIPLVTICWMVLPEEDKVFATGFESKRANIGARLAFIDLAWSQFRANPILGAGVGLRKELDATNVILMTLAETGVIGLFSFLLIHFALIKMVWRAHRSLSRTSWAFSCLGIGSALLLAKLVHGLVDHYWSRGALTLAWAGAGMATRAYYESQIVPHPSAIRRRIVKSPALRGSGLYGQRPTEIPPLP